MGYNQEHFIEQTIQSAFDQDYEGELEIVLCDDRSPDGTFEVMQRMAAAYTGRHRVIAHRAEKNGRVAVNMNLAVSLSRHPWIMRVDGDDILHPDRARLTALAILRYPEAKAIAGRLEPFSNQPPRVCNPPDSELVFEVSRAEDMDADKNAHGLEWWGCMMTMSRDIFEQFPPLPAICAVLDDTMFATRALMLGEFVIVKNGTMLYYRRHAGNISSERRTGLSLVETYRADQATRDYYRRGCACHEAILGEIRERVAREPEREDLAGLLRHFERRFEQLREQGYFWQTSWAQRRQLPGFGLMARITWGVQTLHPYVYCLVRWLRR